MGLVWLVWYMRKVGVLLVNESFKGVIGIDTLIVFIEELNGFVWELQIVADWIKLSFHKIWAMPAFAWVRIDLHIYMDASNLQAIGWWISLGLLLLAIVFSLVIWISEDRFKRSTGEDLGKYYPIRPECEEDVPKSRFKHWVWTEKTYMIFINLFWLLISVTVHNVI